MSTIGRFARAFRRSPTGIAASVMLLLLMFLVVFAPAIWGEQASKMNMMRAGEGPSRDHPLGTDLLGRDILFRTLTATRQSILLALSAAAIGILIGFPLGAMISLLGPGLQALGARVIDALLSFPSILLIILLAVIIGPGAIGAVISIGLAWVPWLARISYKLAASLAGREFIANARIIGVSGSRLTFRYLLPNFAETIFLTVCTAVGSTLIAISSLSFLGIGVQPPDYDWGRMLIEGVSSIYVAPAAALAPAFAIAVTGLSLGFLGEALARAMNPLLWTKTDVKTAAASPSITGVVDHEDIGRRSPESTDRDHTHIGDRGKPLLRVEGLTVRFPAERGMVTPVDGSSFSIAEGEVVGIVGESGSGKTMTALAIAQLVPYPGELTADSLEFCGEQLLELPERYLQTLLGNKMAMVFQDPMSSLNPALRVGVQLTEASQVHRSLGRTPAINKAAQRMKDVGIPAPRARLHQYPHEFSGGMRQRAMIAMGLMMEPALVIADEPTTSLDVTIQAQILDLLEEINRVFGTAILLISHDIGVIAEVCSRVMVMYAGRIVEDITTKQLLQEPNHPYSRALMASVPDLVADRTVPLSTIPGRPPDLDALPTGCPFEPRCSEAIPRCKDSRPALEWLDDAHRVACWLYDPSSKIAFRAAGRPSE